MHFILPKQVIKEIEMVLRRFLWTGSELKKWGSKVAWKEVCLPTKEGGLGIRDVHIWNKAAMLRHLWAICARKQSLWVTWCYSNLLKGKCFWEIKIPSDCSWTWRNILKLREIAIHMSKYKVGNGESISLWYANWHPSGPLIPKYTARIAYDAGISKEAKVSKVIVNGRWHWPYPTTWELREVINSNPPSYLPSSEHDEFIWLASRNGMYNVSTTWETIRPHAIKVKWYKLLWFPHSIPRHSFILWLAIKGKLNTKDKLEQWGVLEDTTCILCNESRESLEHLFFQCSFTKDLRKTILDLCFIKKGIQIWQNEIEWAAGRFSKKNFSNTMSKIAWSALIYCIWQERNARTFQRASSTKDSILKEIKRIVRMKAAQVHSIEPTSENYAFCNRWEIHLSNV